MLTRIDPFATLTLNVSGIRRVHFSSGGLYPGSTFIDNVSFTAKEAIVDTQSEAPEPSTLGMAGAALIAIGLAQKRRTA